VADDRDVHGAAGRRDRGRLVPDGRRGRGCPTRGYRRRRSPAATISEHPHPSGPRSGARAERGPSAL